MSISRRDLYDQVVTRLGGVAGLTVYRGKVDPEPPVKMIGGAPAKTKEIANYAVVHGFAGTPTAEAQDVADTHNDLLWSVQVTVVGATEDDCLHAADVVDGLLYRWTPAITGLAFDSLRPPPGFDPGPPRPDKDIAPTRFWLPLQYQLTVTT